MVSLKVYNWEVFDRSTLWYVCFFVVIGIVVFVSLFYESWDKLNGLIWVIILLLIVWGYLFFLSRANAETKMVLKPEWLTIWTRLIPYSQLKGFVVEMDKKTLKFRNIVLVFDRSVEIYTLKDTKKQQELFFSKFSELVPYLEKYDQSSLDRLLRRLKL